MLKVRLTEEDEEKLHHILSVTGSDTNTLLKKLINAEWLALELDKTFVGRAGDLSAK